MVLLPGWWGDCMLADFQNIWSVFGSILDMLPSEVTTVVVFYFCYIGVVGIVRSL